jgi:hypothetical protein
MNIHQRTKVNLSLKGRYRFTLTDIHTGEQDVFEVDNVITEAAWELVANHFVDPTPDDAMLLTEAALGSGISTPAATDTTLQAETYRNNLASKSNDGNVAYVTAYFNATETTGTYREAGIFTADGVLVSRVAINITKSSSQTLTLDWTLTVGI